MITQATRRVTSRQMTTRGPLFTGRVCIPMDNTTRTQGKWSTNRATTDSSIRACRTFKIRPTSSTCNSSSRCRCSSIRCSSIRCSSSNRCSNSRTRTTRCRFPLIMMSSPSSSETKRQCCRTVTSTWRGWMSGNERILPTQTMKRLIIARDMVDRIVSPIIATFLTLSITKWHTKM